LQVLGPQGTLMGIGLPHGVWLHVSPGAVQIPQVALQHTWPGLHIARPHGTVAVPWEHGVWLHVSPGAVQMPQLALQHTWPALQVLRPQKTLTGTRWLAQGV
jgi:hypothetical protein